MIRADQYLERIQGLPWRLMAYLFAISFTMSSIVSIISGYLLLPKTISIAERLPTASEDESFKFSPTLSQSGIDAIIARNIFNREGTVGDATSGKDQKKSDELLKTDLPITLVGTIYGGTPLNGIAVIENNEKKLVNTFMVGDNLLKEGFIKEIYPEKIIIERNSGQREYLEISRPDPDKNSRRKGKVASVASTSPTASGPAQYTSGQALTSWKEDGLSMNNNDIEMTSEFKNKLLSTDFAQVLQDAKAAPNIIDGQLRGFVLTRIRKNSIYEKAGLQDQDIVEEINGVPLNDTGRTIEFLKTLREEREVEIRLRRGGSVMTKVLKVR